MACDCSKSRTRRIIRARGTPPVIHQWIGVNFTSLCGLEPPEDEDGSFFVQSDLDEGRGKATKKGRRQAPAPKAAKRQRKPAAECVNEVIVELLPQTMPAGLKISEVTLGDDTYVTDIAVGGRERWVEFCDLKHCDEKYGSATIVDGKGKFVAKIGGFRICRCKS